MNSIYDLPEHISVDDYTTDLDDYAAWCDAKGDQAVLDPALQDFWYSSGTEAYRRAEHIRLAAKEEL